MMFLLHRLKIGIQLYYYTLEWCLLIFSNDSFEFPDAELLAEPEIKIYFYKNLVVPTKINNLP